MGIFWLAYLITLFLPSQINKKKKNYHSIFYYVTSKIKYRKKVVDVEDVVLAGALEKGVNYGKKKNVSKKRKLFKRRK